MKGPLAPYASGFYAELTEQGYAQSYAERQMWLMSQARIKGSGVVPDLYLLVGLEAPSGLSAGDGLGLHSVSGERLGRG